MPIFCAIGLLSMCAVLSFNSPRIVTYLSRINTAKAIVLTTACGLALMVLTLIIASL
jgi:hypothetical protein